MATATPPPLNKRKKLIPWLLEQLDSGDYPGLDWMDRKEGLFRIPWRRQGRSDCTEEDGKLFKAWALYTGKFKEGEELDYPKWKTNVRCALNKMTSELRVIRGSTDDDFRVYQFIKKEGDGMSPSPAAQTGQLDCSEGLHNCSSPPFQDPASPLNMQGNIPTVVGSTNFHEVESKSQQQQEQVQNNIEPVVSSLTSSLKEMVLTPLSQDLETAGAQNYVSLSEYAVSPPESMETDSLKIHAAAEFLIKEAASQAQLQQQQPQQLQMITDNPHRMMLTVRYKNTELMSNVLVERPQGCRIYHGEQIPQDCWAPKLYGYLEAEQIPMPDISGKLGEQPQLLRDAVKMLTLLKAMHFGFSLFIYNNDIYLHRRCQASLFALAPSPSENGIRREVVKIPKFEEPVKIFDFNNDFWPAFQQYIESEGQSPRPLPLTLVAVGQKFNANNNVPTDPYSGLLLSITVTHHFAASCLEQVNPTAPQQPSYQNCLQQQAQCGVASEPTSVVVSVEGPLPTHI